MTLQHSNPVKPSDQIATVQDVGFDYAGKGGKDNQIIDVYFHQHFPKAVSPSLKLSAAPYSSTHHQ